MNTNTPTLRFRWTRTDVDYTTIVTGVDQFNNTWTMVSTGADAETNTIIEPNSGAHVDVDLFMPDTLWQRGLTAEQIEFVEGFMDYISS